MPTQHFLALEEEKQDRIRRSALQEFGRYGYQKTSVEQIAKAAGISKSMVFHYFGTKLELYKYLLFYSSDTLKVYYDGIEEKLQGLDYIQKYKLLTKIKLKAYLAHQEIFSYITMIYLHPENLHLDPDIEKLFTQMVTQREEVLKYLITSSETDHFRDDLDHEKIKKYINWIIEGFSQQIIAELMNQPLDELYFDDKWEESDKVLDDLRTLFYKQK